MLDAGQGAPTLKGGLAARGERYRNPDEDLPADFEQERSTYLLSSQTAVCRREFWVLGINGTENRVKLTRCCEFGPRTPLGNILQSIGRIAKGS